MKSVLIAALLALTATANANDYTPYQAAYADAELECKHVAPPNVDAAANQTCINITLHDRYGYGTVQPPNPPEQVPAGVTPWGVYRDTPAAAEALK